VRPTHVEFWQGRTSRLHDRLRFRFDERGGAWVVERLAP
jgi:pyridoxamine 5'-phosphate oxidase